MVAPDLCTIRDQLSALFLIAHKLFPERLQQAYWHDRHGTLPRRRWLAPLLSPEPVPVCYYPDALNLLSVALNCDSARLDRRPNLLEQPSRFGCLVVRLEQPPGELGQDGDLFQAVGTPDPVAPSIVSPDRRPCRRDVGDLDGRPRVAGRGPAERVKHG